MTGNGAAANTGFGAYLGLFKSPGALVLSASGLLGRFPASMRSVSCVLLVVAVGGPLRTAGTIAGAIVIAQGLAWPVIGRVADRLGQRRVLLVGCALNAVATGLLAIVIAAHAPLWISIAAALAAGATVVPLGSFVRARWATFAEPHRLRTAYAVESILDEVVFITGPLVVVAIVTGVHPTAGLGACLLLTTVGSVVLARHRRSEPAAAPTDPAGRGRAIGVSGMRVLIVAYLGMGIFLGAVDMTIIAFAREHHVTELTGVLMALTALSSLLSGLWFGAVDWRVRKDRLFLVAISLLGLGAVPLALAGSTLVMAVCAFVSGLVVSPTWITGSALVQSLVPAGSLSEGFAWLSSVASLGSALGIALGGQLADRGGFHWAGWLAVGGGVLAWCATAAGRRALHGDPDGPGTPSATTESEFSQQA
ncbi:MFS transporter [Nocardia sp. CDC159]|uniref:MFS transporter n=1 Tax=Nocardia pulmonis TaxID=2951408 RepID=A0A9X2J2N4_9NOCA|nr:MULTISPECIES: MFS transporter [Nocardia]MCM6778226.1 MFS transporter [Nocardia pulmonis]MCM6791115.1 MFS transporter [Nocardia sp. CDC159]